MQKLNRLLMANPYWQHCKSWYEMRPSGDRKILQLLVTLVFAALIYLLIWEPVSQWSKAQKSNYHYQQEMNTWLHNNLPKARDLQKNQQRASPRQELSSIAANVAQQAGITLGRVQPDRKGLSVWVEDAAYQKLLKWLVLLQTKHGVAIQQVRIDQLKEEGRVKSYIHLGG
ncbi:type II secretion system protein M [Endozoicomonas sp. GU-1]|uniref:type II secretion system protein M n=1 Tax=Endozoicomonas sp. GU-1 TaxID=3009078 RepID=UPI0022B57DA9|nr:type II secretion system protein M [Endozoicomonas sp. GU-1]WBA79997.1 type II secretion system protein M [Endozoicomonas sp. GU-1]WBA87571.1 type II secretion system protein M [Endozoicomonas sp. GU-1]